MHRRLAVHSPRTARISGVKPLPSMTPSTITIRVRSPAAIAMGAPTIDAIVVASMEPIIQGRGKLMDDLSQPPALPKIKARRIADQRCKDGSRDRRSRNLRAGFAVVSGTRSSVPGDTLAKTVHEGLAQGKLL